MKNFIALLLLTYSSLIFAQKSNVEDEQVLENINRSNIKLDHYKEINKHLKKVGRATSSREQVV